MIYITGWFFIAIGVVFFLMGTLALIRFPDLFTRLHALTKADNLGLGMIAAGLALHSGSFTAGIKLLLIWLLIMLASASVSHLIARTARNARHGKEYNA
ncbi:MAG: monovalent cation/H(+) antiporter subunit G [Gammaproteobacteria bacterium]|jgi:multicomponent Na+:H+ antiporter subunit G